MNTMGAKGKYQPEVIDAILEAIRETGRDADGIQAAGISSDTFYRWKSDKSDFSEKISKAKAVYRSTRPTIMRQKAVERLSEYINGTAVERWDYEETITNSDGSESTRSGWREIKRACPQWAIDRILGKSLPVLEAVQVLLNEGVATPAQAAVVESHINSMQADLKNLASSEEQRAQLEKVLNEQEPQTIEAEVIS